MPRNHWDLVRMTQERWRHHLTQNQWDFVRMTLNHWDHQEAQIHWKLLQRMQQC